MHTATLARIEHIFRRKFHHYTPKEIRQIRRFLNEDPDTFGARFFADGETVSGWECEEGTRRHRSFDPRGTRTMMIVEQEAVEKRAAKIKAIEANMKRKTPVVPLGKPQI